VIGGKGCGTAGGRVFEDEWFLEGASVISGK